jgi:hypothetical protein
MSPDSEGNLEKRPERRGPKGKVTEIKLPVHPVIAEWQPVGDIGADHVLVKKPVDPPSRRSDDPKPPEPHDMGIA